MHSFDKFCPQTVNLEIRKSFYHMYLLDLITVNEGLARMDSYYYNFGNLLHISFITNLQTVFSNQKGANGNQEIISGPNLMRAVKP